MNPSDEGEDWSLQGRMAREDARRLAMWEERRGGRPIRLWEAEIEVRTAATDRDNARTRLANYLRHPYYRIEFADALLSYTHDLAEDPGRPGAFDVVQHLPDADVDSAERARLQA